MIDDERPALDELAFLLERDARVAEVHTTDSPTEALRLLQQLEVDAVFLDIQMPGLTGIELAQVLARFKTPPAAVFVTAHDQHAVDAFDLNAVDYVLKPVREERLAEAVRRVLAATRPEQAEEQVPVERGGVTRFVPVSEIRYVEAEGDYARLHTADDSHLVRVPLSQLEQDWADAGFLRIHRSLLIATAFVDEVHVDGGRCSVVIGDQELQVSRRHTRELRDLLVRSARPGADRREEPREPAAAEPPPAGAGHQPLDRPAAGATAAHRHLRDRRAERGRRDLRAHTAARPAPPWRWHPARARRDDRPLPLVFVLAPGLTDHHVLGMPVSWGVLAFGCYPVLVLPGLALRPAGRAQRARLRPRRGASS